MRQTSQTSACSAPFWLVFRSALIVHAVYAPPSHAQTVFGPGGVLEGASDGKCYVDMSTVDEQTSTRIAEALAAKGTRFLEVCCCFVGGVH